MDEADTAQDIAGDNTQSTEEILAPLGQKNTTSIKAEPDSSASEFDALFSRLSNQGSHDPHTWKRLIRLASGSGEISKIHHAYDELLKRYPNTSSAQIAHIGHFLNGEATFAEAERLFIKYLRGSPDVDLWKFYLDYVRRRNVDPKTRGIVRDSYEFALKHVGQDKNAGKIWYDYIQFLKAGDAFSTSEEQQKMDAIRKAYHRAVKIPLDDVERIWFELETFENSLNKITAKRFTSDLSPAYMKARAVLKPLTSHLNALYPSSQDFFLPSLPVFDAADRNLVGRWKAYLKWEESNPLEIEDQEKEALNRRIQGVYRKAVIRMRFYPEIWYMAYNWTKSIGKPDDALLILKAGMDANPTSYLLTFVYVEVMEREKDYAEVHTTFERFLGLQSKILDELQDSPEVTANGSFNGSHPASQSTNGSFGSQSSDNKPPKLTELQERRTEYGLVYVLYMRFARRAEGLQALRKVFGKARKDKWATWEVYEANALMEYHCFDNKAVANRIFEKGLEHFGDEVEYVSCYLGFLISINDGNNARALFERVRTTFSPEQARPLWERWSRYEYQYGDLESARKLGKQVSEAYPNDPPIKLFAQRHVYLGVDAIAARDLGAAYARRHHVNNGTTASTSSSSQARGMEITPVIDHPERLEDHPREADRQYPTITYLNTIEKVRPVFWLHGISPSIKQLTYWMAVYF
ncbi:hypothetical protein EST38_g5659 [Candolleomyces aberdarensis]|uniref:mRNA 3'-end-processing protein RNA14 n=1 Tax=Candolleomyces aberdarensis TaxID=2316362 RepID=A0A4Q2DJZ9_9AGAR|nr:hypothetical protein EST38_g5659 [Candolleomyces aberdarensis]